MTNKGAIIDLLGVRALLLPRKLEDALAANDRLKVCFTLLQARPYLPGKPPGHSRASGARAGGSASVGGAVGVREATSSPAPVCTVEVRCGPRPSRDM